MLRIGIVGTGIAGLTAGWLLARSGAAVTFLERQSTVGMDAHSFDVDRSLLEPDASPSRIDVPPRMFNRSQWPTLFRLYQEIGVEMEPVVPTKSFGMLGKAPLFKLGASYQPQSSLGLVFNSSLRKIFRDIRRMRQEVPAFLDSHDDMSMKVYLARNHYSDAFTFEFLYPALSSTVCTCCYDSLDAYPASVLLQTMTNLMQPEGLFRTRHGTQDVVRRLTADANHRRVEASVTSVVQNGLQVEVTTETRDRFEFDHLIVATQANSALRIVKDLTPFERDLLATFRYEEIPVVVHTDRRLMPPSETDWSHFNLISNREKTAAMCTIWMNQFYPESDFACPVFQTMMPLAPPRNDSIMIEASMQRPTVNFSTIQALESLERIHDQPNRRIWFCGSYASQGTPLLESGVVSSLKIAERLGSGWPDSRAA